MLRALRGLVLALVFGNLALFLAGRVAAGMDEATWETWALLYSAVCVSCVALSGWAEMAPGLKELLTLPGSFAGAAIGAGVAEYQLRLGNSPDEVVADNAVQSLLAEPEQGEAVQENIKARVSRLRLRMTMQGMAIRYHNGQKVTRSACVDSGLCNQQYWNLANAILIQLGLKEHSRWHTRGNLDEDAKWITARTRVIGLRGEEQIWIRPSNEDNWAEVDPTPYLN